MSCLVEREKSLQMKLTKRKRKRKRKKILKNVSKTKNGGKNISGERKQFFIRLWN